MLSRTEVTDALTTMNYPTVDQIFVCQKEVADNYMTAALNEDLRKGLLEKIPLNKFGSADDIASAALYLAGESGRYITGQVLTIDGGMVM